MAQQRLTFQDNALLDAAKQPMLLDKVKQMGGVGIQQDVQFGDVFKNGQYDFSKYDAEVNAARARGLNDITFRLYGTPAYQTNGADTALSANHPNAVLAGKFAEQVAQHFKGRVSRYGVWNEPNIGAFINQDTRQAAGTYRQIYQQMFRSLKGVDPRNQVGLGEVTSMRPDTKGTQSTLGFLRAVLSGPKPLHADYVSIHPYQWSDPSKKPGNAQFGGVSNLPAVQEFLDKMHREGRLSDNRGHRPELTASEFGYKHDVGNAATRAAWLHKSMQLFRQAGVNDVNLYQLLPSKQGDYWDSSILGAQGQIPPEMLHAIRGRR